MENHNRKQSERLSQLTLNTPKKLNPKQSYLQSGFAPNTCQDIKKVKQNIELNNTLHANCVDYKSTDKNNNPPKRSQTDPLYIKYLSLCEVLIRNNHTLAEIYIQPSNVSKILKHDSVCIQQLTVTLIQSNKLSYQDASFELQKILKAFKTVMEILKDKMMGLDRWLESITFKKRQDENLQKEGRNQKGIKDYGGILDKCTLCECYLTERKIKQVYGQLSQKPKLLVPTLQESFRGIQQQDSDDQNQKFMIQRTISNFKHERERLINSKTAKADSYLTALIEQQSNKSNQIMDFLKKNDVQIVRGSSQKRGTQLLKQSSYENQFNQKKLIFNTVIQQMADKIKKFISKKYARKFQQLTNLLKEKSVQMMTGNQRNNEQNANVWGQAIYEKFQQENLHFQIDDKIIKVKQKVYQGLVIHSAELQKQLVVLRQNSVKLQSSRRSLEVLCRNLSAQKARLQESCQQLQKDKQALISKMDERIIEQASVQTQFVFFHTQQELLNLFKDFKKKGSQSLLTYLSRRSSISGCTFSKQAACNFQEEYFGEYVDKVGWVKRNSKDSKQVNDLPEIPQFSGKNRRGSQTKSTLSKILKRKNSSAGFNLKKRNSNIKQNQSIAKITISQDQEGGRNSQSTKNIKRISKMLSLNCQKSEQKNDISYPSNNQNMALINQKEYENSNTMTENKEYQNIQFKRIKKINKSYFGKGKSKIKTEQNQKFLTAQLSKTTQYLQRSKWKQSDNNFYKQLQQIKSQKITKKETNEAKQYQTKKYQKLFTISDLDLFGGLSHAFSNKSVVIDQEIGFKLIKMAEKINEFIFSLETFKNKSLFQSIISFLHKPFETASNGEIFYSVSMGLPSTKNNTLKKIKNILLFHKNCQLKQGSQICCHLRIFFDKLGMPWQSSQY